MLELELHVPGYINLVLASTQCGQTLEQVFEPGNILVGWGTVFAQALARHCPDIPAAVRHVNPGVLALLAVFTWRSLPSRAVIGDRKQFLPTLPRQPCTMY